MDKKNKIIAFATTEKIEIYLKEKSKKEERSTSWIVHKIIEEHYKKEENESEHSEQLRGG